MAGRMRCIGTPAQVRAGGEQGIGWTYGSPACAAVISGVLAGVVHGRLRDLGARRRPWDLKAKRLGLPLYRLLGVRRDNVPVFCSGGFTCYDDDQLRDQLSGWASGH